MALKLLKLLVKQMLTESMSYSSYYTALRSGTKHNETSSDKFMNIFLYLVALNVLCTSEVNKNAGPSKELNAMANSSISVN